MFRILSITLVISFFCLTETRGQKNIKGSGYVLTEQRTTNGFSNIEVCREIKVFIVQGALQPIVVEADDNLFPYIKTIVRNNTLKIYIPDSVDIIKYADMNVLISMPELTSLKATTGSRINGSPQLWKADTVKLETDNSAFIKLHIKAQNTDIKARSSGTVELKGESENFKATLNAASQLYGRNFKVENAELELGTASKAEIEVEGKASYMISGNARLTLRGNPVIVKSQLTSGGKVTREQ